MFQDDLELTDVLSPEQIQELHKFFDMYDKEKSGAVHTTQVGQILRTMGQPFDDSDLKNVVKEFDPDGTGMMEFDAFAFLVAKFIAIQEDEPDSFEDELREAFRLYDKEGNGYINVMDLRDIMKSLDEEMTDEDLDDILADIDSDGSGTVDFEEFMEMMLAAED